MYPRTRHEALTQAAISRSRVGASLSDAQAAIDKYNPPSPEDIELDGGEAAWDVVTTGTMSTDQAVEIAAAIAVAVGQPELGAAIWLVGKLAEDLAGPIKNFFNPKSGHEKWCEDNGGARAKGPKDPLWWPYEHFNPPYVEAQAGSFRAFAYPVLRLNVEMWTNCKPTIDNFALLEKLESMWNHRVSPPTRSIKVYGSVEKTALTSNGSGGAQYGKYLWQAPFEDPLDATLKAIEQAIYADPHNPRNAMFAGPSNTWRDVHIQVNDGPKLPKPKLPKPNTKSMIAPGTIFKPPANILVPRPQFLVVPPPKASSGGVGVAIAAAAGLGALLMFARR